MSDTVLSYATVHPRRQSWAGTGSMVAGGLSNVLFLAGFACYELFERPALRAGDQAGFEWDRRWLVLMPVWAGIALAGVGGVLAIVGLAIPGRRRGRAVAGLVLSLLVGVWMAVT